MQQTNILMFFKNNEYEYKPYEYYIPKGTKWSDIDDEENFSCYILTK